MMSEQRLWRLLEAKFLLDTARRLMLRAMTHLAEVPEVDRAFYALSAALKQASEACIALEDEIATMKPAIPPRWLSTREVIERVLGDASGGNEAT